MTSLYIRAYEDYSYEIIFLEGIVRKTRIHLLINPSKHIKLPGQGDEMVDPILNIESLTHIVAMETSIGDKNLIKRTVHLAERTNKPIITNQETAETFKESGLSVKQLRILGFQEEVIDNLKVDPVYLEEIEEENSNNEQMKSGNLLDLGKNMIDKINPLKWKPIKKLSNRVLNKEEIIDEDINPSNPVGFQIKMGGNINILLPIDKRGMVNINKIIPETNPWYLIIPNQKVNFTKQLVKGPRKVIILNNSISDDDLLVLPKSYNKTLPHDTYYGALEQWVDLTTTS